MNSNNKEKISFTKLNHEWWDYLLVKNFTVRQLKIIYLVIRLTYGIKEDNSHHSEWAVRRKTDLQSIGILPSHAKEVMQDVLGSGIVTQSRSGEFQINLDELKRTVEKDTRSKARLEKLKHLVRKNLTKYFPN